MKKLILWGTGFYGEKYVKRISSFKDSFEIVAFCDNDNQKWGKKFYDIGIISPFELKQFCFDILVVVNSYMKEIKEEINQLSLCDSRKVFSMYELDGLLYSHEQFENLKLKKSLKSGLKYKKKRCTVYTALIGNSYPLKDPEFISDDITYICYTNNKEIKSDIWNIEYVSSNNESEVMLARRIKLLPWEYMKTEELVCWIDTKFLIYGDLCKYIDLYWNDRGMLCFPHYERKCICDETAAIIPYKPDLKMSVILQTALYLQKGYPINNGLYESGCIVRDINDEYVRLLMKLWWNEIESHTYRDQISLPYIFWKTGYNPDVSDEYINHNCWFVLHGY